MPLQGHSRWDVQEHPQTKKPPSPAYYPTQSRPVSLQGPSRARSPGSCLPLSISQGPQLLWLKSLPSLGSASTAHQASWASALVIGLVAGREPEQTLPRTSVLKDMCLGETSTRPSDRERGGHSWYFQRGRSGNRATSVGSERWGNVRSQFSSTSPGCPRSWPMLLPQALSSVRGSQPLAEGNEGLYFTETSDCPSVP